MKKTINLLREREMMIYTTFKPEESLLIQDGIYKTRIPGLLYIEHRVFADQRGFYAELSRIPEINAVIGFDFEVKQLNHARSTKHVARGFHAENWNKLVTVMNGNCFSALADVRPESETFGQTETFLLGPENGALTGSLFISSGIANSLCVIEGTVDYLYAVDKLYKDRDPNGDRAISLFDETLEVAWPIDRSEMIISERDSQSLTLKQLYPEKVGGNR